jgi:NADH dehydrogenase
MAKVAARNVAELDAEYAGFVNGAAKCVGEWRVGATGFTAAYAETRGIVTVEGHSDVTTTFPMMPGRSPCAPRSSPTARTAASSARSLSAGFP